MNERTSTRLLPLAAGLLLAACHGTGVRGGRYVAYETTGPQKIELARMVDDLATADVVFLGEEHDNGVGHALQLRTIRMLYDRDPSLAISMEQFEVDVQPLLDAYLAHRISEAVFLEGARPWSNYEQDYRPIVEWARENGVPVIAANIPRPLAARVARQGYWPVAGNADAPWGLNVDEPAYRARFEEAMGGHGGMESVRMDRWFAAQCIKDDTMAESIADFLDAAGPVPPRVVHLCGKFHSDQRLGTVSRLLLRKPELTVRVVTMSSGKKLRRELSDQELVAADYVWRVPSPH